MKKLPRLCFGAVFGLWVFWWANMFLMCLPNNFIKIQLHDYHDGLETFFYQKWSFFAPPPTFNTRLYYAFLDKETGTQWEVVEVLVPLAEQKQAGAPFFNTEADLINNILEGGITGIYDTRIELVDQLKIQSPDSSDRYYAERAVGIISDMKEEMAAYQTLANYAQVIAHEHQIDPARYDAQFSITVEDIPKFKDRLEARAEDDAIAPLIIYRSPMFSLAPTEAGRHQAATTRAR